MNVINVIELVIGDWATYSVVNLNERVVDSNNLDVRVVDTIDGVIRMMFFWDCFNAMQLTHCGRPMMSLVYLFQLPPQREKEPKTYNAANTTETVDTNLDNHDCGCTRSC